MYYSMLNGQHGDHVRHDIDEIAGAKDFCIFTSFRVDVPSDPAAAGAKLCEQNQPFPFSLHQERLICSAEAFGWSYVADWLSGPLGLQRLAEAVGAEVSGKFASAASPIQCVKGRLTVSRDAAIGVECSPLAAEPSNQADSGMCLPKELVLGSMGLRSCKVVLDTEPLRPSLFTTHKTSARIPYESARERANLSKVTPDHGEVLLFNPSREIMEASNSTPYFYRAGRWVTPPLSSGGNAGVTRRVALENGLCAEEIVQVDSLCHGETVWISNGVRGFLMGTLHLHS
jgi:4-amino-4-deoxychorismate lyase